MLRWLILMFVLGLAFVVAFALFLYRPSPILGVDDRSLAYSVERSVNAYKARCRTRSEGGWRCSAFDASGSGNTYRVDMQGLGCWKGRLSSGGSAELASREKVAGCIGIRDHLRLWERLFEGG